MEWALGVHRVRACRQRHPQFGSEDTMKSSTTRRGFFGTLATALAGMTAAVKAKVPYFIPTPQQAEALIPRQSSRRTEAMLRTTIRRCLMTPQYHALVMVPTYSHIVGHAEPIAHQILMEVQRTGWRWHEAEKTIRFDNGSWLKFGYPDYSDEKIHALTRYMGYEFNEVTDIGEPFLSPAQTAVLTSRIRSHFPSPL